MKRKKMENEGKKREGNKIKKKRIGLLIVQESKEVRGNR